MDKLHPSASTGGGRPCEESTYHEIWAVCTARTGATQTEVQVHLESALSSLSLYDAHREVSITQNNPMQWERSRDVFRRHGALTHTQKGETTQQLPRLRIFKYHS